jgi:hypothetical protein
LNFVTENKKLFKIYVTNISNGTTTVAQLSKAEQNRIAVANHCTNKFDIEEAREVSKEYAKKYRTIPDNKQQENGPN